MFFLCSRELRAQSTCGVRRRADREASLGSGGPAGKTLRLNTLFQVRQRCKSATAVHGPATHRDRQRRLGPAQPRSPAPTMQRHVEMAQQAEALGSRRSIT